MSWKKSLIFIVGLMLLGWFIYYQVDFKKVGEALYTFPKSHFVGVLLLSFLILSLKATRFWMLLHKFTIKTHFWQAFRISFAGGITSPLPGGEFFRGILVKHETKEDFTRISGAVISQSYFETSVAVILMIVGVVIIEDDFLPFALAALGFVVIFALVLAFKQSTRWIQHLLPSYKRINGFMDFLQEIQKHSFEAFINREKKRPRKVFFELMSITLIAHLLGGMLLWLIFNGLSIEIDLLASVFMYSTSIVIAGIGSIVPGGIGIIEGGLLGLMALFGVQPTLAVAVILLFRIATLLFSILLGVIFFTIFYGKYYLAKWRIMSI